MAGMSLTSNLNAYKYFETVARLRAITRAEEELSVSPSAVSQQFKLLEQRLGVKLFLRDGRHVSITLEGEKTVPDRHYCAAGVARCRTGGGKDPPIQTE